MYAPDLPLPLLQAPRAELTREIEIVDASGQRRTQRIPLERALTLYVDKREVVTLMTLGQEPALLALGYLLNQGLIDTAHAVRSIDVDWDVGAAAIRLHDSGADWSRRVERRTVTTGCGQGTVFGDWLESVAALPPAARAGSLAPEDLTHVLDAMRAAPSVHREAGSVHGTALWRAGERLVHIEDVGRHNAVDTVAGWMAMRGIAGDGALLYTTGRLTSEMVVKAARLRVPIVVSRNGVTSMGHELAQRLNVTLIGRASGRRWLCYTGGQRLSGLLR